MVLNDPKDQPAGSKNNPRVPKKDSSGTSSDCDRSDSTSPASSRSASSNDATKTPSSKKEPNTKALNIAASDPQKPSSGSTTNPRAPKKDSSGTSVDCNSSMSTSSVNSRSSFKTDSVTSLPKKEERNKKSLNTASNDPKVPPSGSKSDPKVPNKDSSGNSSNCASSPASRSTSRNSSSSASNNNVTMTQQLSVDEREKAYQLFVRSRMSGTKDKLTKESFRKAMQDLYDYWNSMTDQEQFDFYQTINASATNQIADIAEPPKPASGYRLWMTQSKKTRNSPASADLGTKYFKKAATSWKSLPKVEKDVFTMQSLAESLEYADNMELLHNKKVKRRCENNVAQSQIMQPP